VTKTQTNEKQTDELLLNGQLLTRKEIEEMIDNMSANDIVGVMTNGKVVTKGKTLDWVPLVAMQVYADTTGAYPIRDNKNWFKNCREGHRRLDVIDSSMSFIIQKLLKKGFLTNRFSTEWKNGETGVVMYSIEYQPPNGAVTRCCMHDGDRYRFKNLADAENYLDLYIAILEIMLYKKYYKPYSKKLVIISEIAEEKGKRNIEKTVEINLLSTEEKPKVKIHEISITIDLIESKDQLS